MVLVGLHGGAQRLNGAPTPSPGMETFIDGYTEQADDNEVLLYFWDNRDGAGCFRMLVVSLSQASLLCSMLKCSSQRRKFGQRLLGGEFHGMVKCRLKSWSRGKLRRPGLRWLSRIPK